MIPNVGVTWMTLILKEGRMGLIHKRPSYRPTGTRPSPRSAWEWSSVICSVSLPSGSKPALCTLWLRTGNIVTLHWVVTRGSRWLALRPPYKKHVTRRGSMLFLYIKVIPKQELVSLQTIEVIATAVIPELALAQVGLVTTQALVGTRQSTEEIMETNTSKPLGTSWFSDKEINLISNKWTEKKLVNSTKGFADMYI